METHNAELQYTAYNCTYSNMPQRDSDKLQFEDKLRLKTLSRRIIREKRRTKRCKSILSALSRILR